MGSQPNLRRGKSHNLVQGQVAKGQAATIQGQVATGDPDPVESSTKDLLLQMWERKTPKGTGLQGCGCYMQRVWKERTL